MTAAPRRKATSRSNGVPRATSKIISNKPDAQFFPPTVCLIWFCTYIVLQSQAVPRGCLPWLGAIEAFAWADALAGRWTEARSNAGKESHSHGGSYGIGSHLVAALVAEGASVASLARSADLGEKQAAELGAKDPGKIRFYRCDVTDRAQVKSSFAAAATDFGGIDALVHVAGVERGPHRSMRRMRTGRM